ncbi:MAG TPA: type VI secretion system membrane subunit TssM, partial [Polyangiaceae bacterium]
MLWLIIVAALLIAVTWPVVVLLEGPLWVAIAITCVLVLAVAVVFVVRLVRDRLRAAALERELLKQAQQQAERVRPDRRPEILALQAQMKTALDTLKRSKLGGGGKAALYALPWYVVIGPPAAGKTTALSQSGLGFITPAGASGSKVRGTAGTRNCDWWFSQHAILLDTAGRFATEEDDREEWMSFLDTLRRFRTNRPLDGIVVALSVEDLLTQTEEQMVDTVNRLRARADELMSRLEMVLPIYVVFTKVDLVAGFVEFWGDLTKQQRAQAWGASFGLDDERLDDPFHAVEVEFDTLVRVLHARMNERLAREPQPEVRARVLQFPMEFRALKLPVARFIDELCRPNPYNETPFVRGFYFSSGTQTGRSIDRVIGNMARGFDLGMLGAAEARPTEPRSFFVTDLFSKVVFPDRHLAARSRSRLKRGARRQLVWGGAAVAGTLVLVTPAAVSYVTNAKLIRATERDVGEARALERTGEAAAAASALDLLLERTERLEKARARASVHGLFGPYAAEPLHGALEGVYLERLRAMVEGDVRTQLTSDVRAIGDLVRTDPKNFQSAYEDLKLYVMLSQPSRLQLDFATPKLAEVWARALNSQASGDQQKLSSHARRYLTALGREPSWAWKPDPSSLSHAQGRLGSLPIDELRFGWLVDAARGAPPIRPEKIFFGASAQYWTAKGDVEVPGMYTALGWEKIRKMLESPDTRLELEPWVLGRTGPDGSDSKESAADRLREIYFQRYVSAWSDFLAGLDVLPPNDLNGALEELRVLAEAEGPYVRLFRALGDNVRLDIGPSSLLDKALEKGKQVLEKTADKLKGEADAGAPPREISSVERHFQPLLRFAFGEAAPGGKPDSAPSGLGQYLTHLSTLEVSLSQLAESKEVSGAEFGAELSRTASAVQRLLAGIDPRTRMILEPLLMNPIRGSRAGVVRADFVQLSGDWKTEVWEIFRTKIKPRYPFSDVANEMTIAEFAEFFRPGTGLLWKFHEQNFAARLDRSGNQFVPKSSADPLPFRPDFLACLNVAQEITDATFGNGQEPNVPFAVKIHPVSSNISEVQVVIDGQATTYRNEPERWIPTQWPGKGDPRGAVLKVKGAGFTDEIPRMGDFGLFRLLAAGGTKPSGQLADGVPVLAARWILTRGGEPPVNVDIKPSKSVHPFA